MHFEDLPRASPTNSNSHSPSVYKSGTFNLNSDLHPTNGCAHLCSHPSHLRLRCTSQNAYINFFKLSVVDESLNLIFPHTVHHILRRYLPRLPLHQNQELLISPRAEPGPAHQMPSPSLHLNNDSRRTTSSYQESVPDISASLMLIMYLGMHCGF